MRAFAGVGGRARPRDSGRGHPALAACLVPDGRSSRARERRGGPWLPTELAQRTRRGRDADAVSPGRPAALRRRPGSSRRSLPLPRARPQPVPAPAAAPARLDRGRSRRGAEALDEGDGAAQAPRNAPLMSRAPTELGEERAEEGAEYCAREPRVVDRSETPPRRSGGQAGRAIAREPGRSRAVPGRSDAGAPAREIEARSRLSLAAGSRDGSRALCGPKLARRRAGRNGPVRASCMRTDATGVPSVGAPHDILATPRVPQFTGGGGLELAAPHCPGQPCGRARSRSTNFWTFPAGFIGSASTISTRRGTL